MNNGEHVLGQIKFALGYDCNMSCGFCLQQQSDIAPSLDFEWVKKTLQEDMVKRDLKRITLTGGEPLHESYMETSLRIVRLASKLDKES